MNAMPMPPNEAELAEARKQFETSYMGRMCPYLTAMSARQDPARVLTPNGAPTAPAQVSEAMGCQGPNCMLFVPSADERGIVRGGGCALALLPLAISQLRDTNASIAQKFIGNYKIVPRKD